MTRAGRWEQSRRSARAALAGHRSIGHTGRVSAASQQHRVVSWPAVVFVLIAVVHLVGVLLDQSWTVATKWGLVPPLMAHLVLNCRTVRSRLVRLVLIALLLSWLGDSVATVMPADWQFVTLVAFFAAAQLVFCLAFLPWWRRSIIASRPQLLVPYLIGIVGMAALTISASGNLWVAVVVYGLLLMSMSALATGLNPLTTWGGVFFVLSDGLLAVRAFVPVFDRPLMHFVIMLLYLLAQACLVLGVLKVQWRGPAPRSLLVRTPVTSTVGSRESHSPGSPSRPSDGA